MEKVKLLFRVDSTLQLFLVFLVFSITGSSAAYLAGPILEALHITPELSTVVYWALRILIIFPIYQILLIFVAACFGQLRYFWVFEQKFLKRIGIRLPDLKPKPPQENPTSQSHT